jgi:hypothetical protein
MGDMTKVTVVDAGRALVLAQHLYDVNNQLIASATTTNHIRDGVSGVNLPRQIELQLPTTQMSLRIDVVNWEVNTLGPQHANTWTKPDFTSQGIPNVDLADPNLQFGLPGQPLTGAAIDPRAHGGLLATTPAWSPGAPAIQTATVGGVDEGWLLSRQRKARLGLGRTFTSPLVTSATTNSTTAPPFQPTVPPVVQLPTPVGPIR